MAKYPAAFRPRRMQSPADLRHFPEQAIRLANIVSMWNGIEDLCALLLEQFVGTAPDHSRALLHSQRGASSKLSLVRAAGEYVLKSHPRLDEFRSLMERIDKLARQVRNPYVHNVYGVDEKGRRCLLDRRFDWLEGQEGTVIVTIKALDRARQDLVAAYNRAVVLSNELWTDPAFANLRESALQTQMHHSQLRFGVAQRFRPIKSTSER
jgi:hypothetical protein